MSENRREKLPTVVSGWIGRLSLEITELHQITQKDWQELYDEINDLYEGFCTKHSVYHGYKYDSCKVR